MPMFIDSPSGERPPKLKRTIGLWMLLLGVPVLVLMMWWRGRDTGQDAIPERLPSPAAGSWWTRAPVV